MMWEPWPWSCCSPAVPTVLCRQRLRNRGQIFTLGAAVGYHDVDSDDSADPHVNGYTYALLVGYDWSRYVGVDAELMRMNRGLMWMFSAGGYPLAQMRSVSRHVSNGP